MKIKLLHFRLLWTTLAALAVFAILASLDMLLKRRTGFGTADLQRVSTAADFDRIAGAWRFGTDLALAGFNLGFDYLFMPLYGFAFYYGALTARDAFAPSGLLRRAFTLLAAVPLAGALFDALENALESFLLIAGATDQVVSFAFKVTHAKFLCFYVGLGLWLLGLIGLAWRRKPAS